MIANVSAHRRANAFAQALEEQSDQGAAAEQSAVPRSSEEAERNRLVALAADIGERPKPELDPEVKVVQRAQLVAAMEAMLQEGAVPGGEASVPEQRSRKGAHRASPLGKLRPRSRLSKGLAAGGLTIGVAAGSFGGVAAASSDALPGDSLYGLKRGMEDFKLGLAGSDSSRGELHLDQASTRLHEARRLMERGRSGSLDHESVGEIRRALSGMRHNAAEGHRLLHEAHERDGAMGPLQSLESFSRSHRDSWTALRDRLPIQLTDVSQEVSSVFDAIDAEVGPLQSGLPLSPDDKQRGSERPGQRSPGAPGEQDSSRPPSSSGSGAASDGATPGSGTDKPGGSSRPTPDSSGAQQDDGLIGGGTGGLLNPPEDETSPTPSDDGDNKGESGSGPAPDVTIPPLLPDLIPGLGLEAEDQG
ncbi:DUF5667 domain-containing protein [Streptomyces apocyni]|uniref:DUF5667 domain-containing protein n=1 Tax=Streptomyces apocyni TaxID=2654677 RepID=UPI0012E9CA03|nr:DUF5667 domain-containing protein [Streptomyces apocyni]